MKIHIHRLIQQQDIDYATAYKKYGKFMDENSMIDEDVLSTVNE